jgi:hypothetical protein
MKNSRTRISVVLAVALTCQFAVVAPRAQFPRDWFLKIRPIEMARKDIDNMSQVAAVPVDDDQILYRLKEGNLFVGLSLGRCKKTSWGTWDVEQGTVLHVTFYPSKERKPSHFGLTTEGMQKDVDHGHDTYTSEEKGLYFSVEFGKLRGVTISPPSKHSDLACKK